MNHQINTSLDKFNIVENKDTKVTELNEQIDSEKSIKVDKVNEQIEKHSSQFCEDAESPENNFPFDVFPSPFRELILECNSALNFPVDYMGSAIIAAVSTAVGKSARLKVKKGWSGNASFYIAIVGNAGANKSHPLEMAFNPFQKIDHTELQKFKIEYNEFEVFQSLSTKDKAKQPKPIKPILLKTVLHNITPEILFQRLSDNDRGCIVVSDELASFWEGINNYSKGDPTGNFLSLWSNMPTSIDRVKHPIPFIIPHQFLNIIGGIQPRVLPKLFTQRKSDNGLLQRFLFAYPTNAEKQPINDIEINESLILVYNDWINNYRNSNPINIDHESGLSNSKTYSWSPEAKKFFYEWHIEHTILVNDNGDSLKGEIISKFDIHFVRLSLVLQIMFDYRTNRISLQATEGAAKLCSYFLRTALKVLELLQSGDPVIMLPINKQILYHALPAKFTTGEAIAIGKEIDNGGKGFDEKAVDRFIKDQSLFVKVKHGHYRKKSEK
jgi:hypothetical protein